MNPDLEAPPGTPMVTLATGEAVFSSDPAWRAECLSRHNHVLQLRGIRDAAMRRQYVAEVERKEGAESAKRLKTAYTVDWEERKAAAQAAMEGAK